MKKVYTKPEIELIDLTAKELLMNGDDYPDPILDKYGIGGWETDVSVPDGWM